MPRSPKRRDRRVTAHETYKCPLHPCQTQRVGYDLVDTGCDEACATGHHQMGNIIKDDLRAQSVNSAQGQCGGETVIQLHALRGRRHGVRIKAAGIDR